MLAPFVLNRAHPIEREVFLMAVFSFEYVDSIFGVCPTLASTGGEIILSLRAYRLILCIGLPSGRH